MALFLPPSVFLGINPRKPSSPANRYATRGEESLDQASETLGNNR
jgi:hypothetical protein